MQRQFGLFILLSLLLMPTPAGGQAEDGEIVAYFVSSHRKGTLGYYDPAQHESRVVLTSTYRLPFALSSDGMLAYGVDEGTNWEVNLIDTSSPNSPVVNISKNLYADDQPLAWSPDGRLLAIESIVDGDTSALNIWDGTTFTNVSPFDGGISLRAFDAEWSPDGRYLLIQITLDSDTTLAYIWDGTTTRRVTPFNAADIIRILDFLWSPDGTRLAYEAMFADGTTWLFVWDGVAITNIMPTEWLSKGVARDATWSQDGRVAFTISSRQVDTASSTANPAQVFVWDGHDTFNLSLNPYLKSYSPAWSADGQVAFVSEDWIKISGLAYISTHLYLWDGTSFDNGAPDRNTFIRIAPDLPLSIYSYPSWRDDGRLVFTAVSPDGIQSYAWDGGQITNLSRNPPYHNSVPRWNDTDLWAFFTFFSSAQLLYIRDAENNDVLVTQGQYFDWLRGDDMIFCRMNRSGTNLPIWNLAYWDGHEITPITDGSEIEAAGQSGRGVICSSG